MSVSSNAYVSRVIKTFERQRRLSRTDAILTTRASSSLSLSASGVDKKRFILKLFNVKQNFSNQTFKMNKDRIVLFDVDGTLTKPRQSVSAEMNKVLDELRTKATVGLVGGSDLSKIEEQMGPCVDRFDYVFSQNGLVAYKGGKLIHNQSFLKFLGEEKLQSFVNFTLRYIADLEIPQKRGTFIEFRQGMLNISPIGRNCSQEERDNFEKFDKESKVREKMVSVLREKFADLGLTFSIGGQISFDVFPKGWDKTYCLKHLEEHSFQEIFFFGDKTYEGGNDYEIFVDTRTNSHTVVSPEDTMMKLREIFALS